MNYKEHLIIILVVLLSVFSCSSPKEGISKVDEQISKDIIVEYGDYIYQREDCKSCHTLSILEESENLISLDGNRGYRSPEWTYLFLQNPKEMMPCATMPSYSHLLEKGLSKATLSEVLNNRGISSAKSIDQHWLKLNEQVDEYLSRLEALRYSAELRSSDLVPLVAYLQNIPPSEYMLYLDSLEAVKQKEKELVLEYYYQYSDSIVASFAAKQETLEHGEKLYAQNCTICHGKKAQGSIGPNLIDEYWISEGDNESILRSIMEGNQNECPVINISYVRKRP